MNRIQCALLLAVFICLLSYSCHKPYYMQQQSGRLYVIEKNAAVDSGLIKMLQPYKAGVDTQMQVVIGHTDMPLTKAQPECTLGNFMADAQMQAAINMDSKVAISI